MVQSECFGQTKSWVEGSEHWNKSLLLKINKSVFLIVNTWVRLFSLGVWLRSKQGSSLTYVTIMYILTVIIISLLSGTGNAFEVSMLIGNCVSLISGGLITVGVTFVTGKQLTEEESLEIWEKTRDIDNPLSPWTELYVRWVRRVKPWLNHVKATRKTLALTHVFYYWMVGCKNTIEKQDN